MDRVAFGQLSLLTFLELWQNQLTGPLPLELANLSALTELALDRNDLMGSAPRTYRFFCFVDFSLLWLERISRPNPQCLGQIDLVGDLGFFRQPFYRSHASFNLQPEK